MRRVIERVGRHAVRLSCGHVETLSAGEADAIGRRLLCERCAAGGSFRSLKPAGAATEPGSTSSRGSKPRPSSSSRGWP